MAGPTALFKTGSPVKQDSSLDVTINLLNLGASLPTQPIQDAQDLYTIT